MPTHALPPTVVLLRRSSAENDEAVHAALDACRIWADSRSGSAAFVITAEDDECRRSEITKRRADSLLRALILPRNTGRTTTFTINVVVAGELFDEATILDATSLSMEAIALLLPAVDDAVNAASASGKPYGLVWAGADDEPDFTGAFAVTARAVRSTISRSDPALLKVCQAALLAGSDDELPIRPDTDLLHIAPRVDLAEVMAPIVRDAETVQLAIANPQPSAPVTFLGEPAKLHNSSRQHDELRQRTAIVRQASRRSGQLWQLLPGEAIRPVG